MQNKWRKAGIEIVRRKGEKKSEDLQYQLVNKTSMSLAARVEVLRDTRPHPWQSAAVSLLAVAILALPTLLVVRPWLGGLV